MGLTQSLSHVTSKMLVLITSNDQVYTIENALFTARRQRKEEAEAKAARELAEATTLPQPSYKLNKTEDVEMIDIKSTLFPPYDGVIPQKNTRYISYDLSLLDLQDIYTFPTRLESTSAVLVTGHDIFFARVTAESIFDRLHENFNSAGLFAAIVGLFVLLYVANTYVKSKESHDKFLTK